MASLLFIPPSPKDATGNSNDSPASPFGQKGPSGFRSPGKQKTKHVSDKPSSSSPLNRMASSDANKMERSRIENLESWSEILEADDRTEDGSVDSDRDKAQEPADNWTADLSELFIGHKFASGAHSQIYRGIYKQQAVAVKIVRVHRETRALLEEQYRSEVVFLSKLFHPNVVQFIAACKKPPVYCIITEYMSQGNLRMYLNKQQPYSLPIETILTLALDISRGMEYLHSQGIIHRDLKSHNLLLNDELRVKVADFGTSCMENQCLKFKGNKGTYRWMAPEMIKEKPYTRKVDVYSFGILLWELVTALLPFQGMTPIQAAFAVSEKDERPPLPESCQPAMAQLIKSCWASNPSKRPDFSSIVSALERYDDLVKRGGSAARIAPPRLVRKNALLGCWNRCI